VIKARKKDLSREVEGRASGGQQRKTSREEGTELGRKGEAGRAKIRSNIFSDRPKKSFTVGASERGREERSGGREIAKVE